jgi:hypothetical protein
MEKTGGLTAPYTTAYDQVDAISSTRYITWIAVYIKADSIIILLIFERVVFS